MVSGQLAYRALLMLGEMFHILCKATHAIDIDLACVTDHDHLTGIMASSKHLLQLRYSVLLHISDSFLGCEGLCNHILQSATVDMVLH